MRKRWIVLLVSALVVQGNIFAATQVDALIEKLVEKGILTRQEGIALKEEIAEDEKIMLKEHFKDNLPQWVRDMKIKGDMRVRYQYEKREGSNLNMGKTTERQRGRFRLRLGAETNVNDQVKANFGIASGSDSDPRSTNQSFQDSFAKKSIWIDYVYAEYTPWQWANFMLGRMKNPIWEPHDMLWDTDINPEGLGMKLNWKMASMSPYINSGIFMLDEVNHASDPWMFVFQPGVKWSIRNNIDLNFATTYYFFDKIQGATLDHSTNNNTRVANGGGNFNAINPLIEINIKEPFNIVPNLALFGEYIHNLDTHQSSNGYTLGFKVGNKKLVKFGDWQFKYGYTLLETFAWPDIFPDSDRYSGRTGVRSHEAALSLALGKNWSLDFDYYRTDLTSTKDKTEDLFQVDLNFKF